MLRAHPNSTKPISFSEDKERTLFWSLKGSWLQLQRFHSFAYLGGVASNPPAPLTQIPPPVLGAHWTTRGTRVRRFAVLDSSGRRVPETLGLRFDPPFH